MFGIKYIWTCRDCWCEYTFTTRKAHREFRDALGCCCPKCGGGLSQVPLPDHKITTPKTHNPALDIQTPEIKAVYEPPKKGDNNMGTWPLKDKTPPPKIAQNQDSDFVPPPSSGSSVEESKSSIGLKVNIDTSEIDRFAIGGRLYDALKWNTETININKIIKSDKETKDILINESELLKLIQLVNQGQPDRHIRLI